MTKLTVCVKTKMTEFRGCVFENVFSPKGAPKNSPKWVCLAGEMLLSIPPPFCPILDPPNAHIRQNPQNDTEFIFTKITYIYTYIFPIILIGTHHECFMASKRAPLRSPNVRGEHQGTRASTGLARIVSRTWHGGLDNMSCVPGFSTTSRTSSQARSCLGKQNKV